MPTLKQLAEQMSQAFEGRERNNGDKFRALKDGSPQWMTDVCHKAHGDMFPDDHRYQFIEEAVDAIAEHDDIDDARFSIEADIYTSDLTTWLGSRADRTGYVDEALEELGDKPPGIVELLQSGQMKEKDEVFSLVVGALTDLADGEPGDVCEKCFADMLGNVSICPQCGFDSSYP